MSRSDFQWWMRKIHLWLSFSIGVVFLIASITGALLVYKWEISLWMNQNLYPEQIEQPVDYQEILSSLDDDYPDQQLHMLWWPYPSSPVYRAAVAPPDAEEWYYDGNQIWFDPNTGKEIGVDPETTTFLDTVNTIHVNLLAGEIGRYIVAISTAGTLIILITGVYLWWPGIRRFFSALWVHTDQGTFRFNYDLHNLMGMVSLPFILVMCLTGVFITWPTIGSYFYHGLFFSFPSGDVSSWNQVHGQYESEPPEGAENPEPAESDTFLSNARAAVSAEADIFYLTFPDEPDELVQVRLQKGTFPWPFGTTYRVYMDQYSGEVLYTINPEELNWPQALIKDYNFELHVGTAGGEPLRILYLISCLLAPALMVTGTIIWWLRSN